MYVHHIAKEEHRIGGRVALPGAAMKTLPNKEIRMLNWALTFFLVALLAAIFGFTGVALAAAGVAKILFFLFLVLFLVSLIAHVSRKV
jgi:uncharacterized membrane protein YtjA (UPF0391 family)